MAKLISDSDFSMLRSVFNDVIETFAQKAITYKKDTDIVTRMNRDLENNRVYVDIALNGLVVWNDKSKDAKLGITTQGSTDESDGYVLFGYDEFLNRGLIDSNKNFTTIPSQDKIQFDGIIYRIVGNNQVAQWKDTSVVVKVHIQKLIRNE